MITREQVLNALKHIEEPGFRKSMVDLNLVKDIMIKENHVALTFILSEPEENIKERLEQEAKAALQALGVSSLHVRFRPMTDFERSEAASKLSREARNREPQGQEQSGQKQKGLDSMQQRTQAELSSMGMPELLKPENQVTFIAVASGKGGVGKSTVTVNLAAALARKGRSVGIIDADIYGFSVPDMMGIEERPKVQNEKIIPVERFGVKVMSMGFFVQDNAPVVWRGPMLGKMLRQFFTDVEWGNVEIVLLDLPPGTGDVALDVHQLIPQSKEIIVTTPHGTAAFVAARAGAMAVQTRHEILGVIENMSYVSCEQCGHKSYIFGRGGGAKLAETLHTELLAQIPLGVPDNHPAEPDFSPSVYKEESEIGRIYSAVADRIIEKLNQGAV